MAIETTMTEPGQPGNRDALAVVGEEPNVQALQYEYQLAWSQDPDAESRIVQAEQVRYTRWAGQAADGLKHQEMMPEGQRAMPYDRAPDTRVNLADDIIVGLVDVDYAAFWNARVKTAPNSTSRLTLAQAAELRAIISWMIHGPLRSGLVDQVEFASQTMHTIGSVVLHPTWRKKTQLRLMKLSWAQLNELAQQYQEQGGDNLLAHAADLVADPTQHEAAAELLRAVFPHLKASEAKRVVEELLRNGPDGTVSFPVPDQVENVPELNVLVPWQDFILPTEATAQPDKARVMFRRVLWSEATVRDRAREEEWNADFVEEAIKTKGVFSEYGTSVEHDQDENLQLIELVYAFSRGVDKDGVPAMWCTVLSPHVCGPGWQAPDRWTGALRRVEGASGTYGMHVLVDHAHHQFPFLFPTTEVTGRRPTDARGVPDVAITAQMEMKQQRDATYVYSQMSVTPPLQKKGTQASKLPSELGPLGIINNTSGGEWSWFPPPAGNPQIAFELQNLVRKEMEDYFGSPRVDTPPTRWQQRQQRRVMRWLQKWGEALWQLAVLAYQNLSADELEAVLGRPALLTAEQVARHRLLLWFDVRALDPAWVESLLKSIAELVLPTDTGGVVDRAKLVQLALSYLDPTLAEEVTSDESGAKQAVFKGVRDEIGSIMQGNEGLYTENDPTAGVKLQFAQQIITANPDYQLQLNDRSPQFNVRKRELMDKWLANLGQSVKQQQNKVIGRLGVKPGPELPQG